ncbi:MAG: hypothetical protein ACK4HQ_08450, partial [Brevinematales bacterium]
NYSGKIRVVVDIMEKEGLGDIQVLYEGKTDKLSAWGMTFYHLDHEIVFSSGGWKTIEIQAYNRIGVKRSVLVDVNVVGPTIRVTNDFAEVGETYTSSLSLSLGGIVSNGLTNIDRVYVRVERPLQTDEYQATMVGMNGWEVNVPLTPNEDVKVTACVVDKAGVKAEDRPITIYQDSRGPQLVALLRPTNNAIEGLRVVFEGKAQDDKVGVKRIVWTTNNGVSWSSRDLEGWWGMREVLGFEFEEWMMVGNHTIQFYMEDFCGNPSKTNTVNFTVDGTYPYVYITGPDGWWCTNETSFPFFGEYANANTVEYSLNSGSWINVSQYGAGKWTNTTTYIPNKENTLRLRAIGASNTNFSGLYRFVIDTIPPQLSMYDTGGSIIVNQSQVRRRIRLEDNLSGIRYFFDILKGKWEYGGTGYRVEINTNEWLGNWYEDEGIRNFPFGAVITNEMVLIDRAGNSNSYSRMVQVYPAIFVTPTGSGTYGIASDPLKAVEGVDKAKSLGVRAVLFSEGTHNLSGVLVPSHNMILGGGFNPAFTSSGGATFLRRPGGRVMKIDGVSGVTFLNFVVAGSGNITEDGPIWVSNGTLYVMNSIFSSNQGRRGSAVYAEASQVGLMSNLFTNNYTWNFGVFYGVGSLYFGVENRYVNNKTYTSSSNDAQLVLLGGMAIISNHMFYLYEGVLGENKVLMDVYAKDMGTFLLHNSVFSTILLSTNATHLWLAGNMQQTSILSNTFVGNVKYLMIKEGDWGGYQLRGNKVYTNSFLVLWAEFLPSATNLIWFTNMADFNNPLKTRATADSTDNQGL